MSGAWWERYVDPERPIPVRTEEIQRHVTVAVGTGDDWLMLAVSPGDGWSCFVGLDRADSYWLRLVLTEVLPHGSCYREEPASCRVDPHEGWYCTDCPSARSWRELWEGHAVATGSADPERPCERRVRLALSGLGRTARLDLAEPECRRLVSLLEEAQEEMARRSRAAMLERESLRTVPEWRGQ